MAYKIQKTEEEWKEILSPEQFRILREKGTERPFTGQYYLNKETGIYECHACGNEIFHSSAKYDSGCGWPSPRSLWRVSVKQRASARRRPRIAQGRLAGAQPT